MNLLTKIIVINLIVFTSGAFAADNPASYSECVLKYVSEDTFPEVAKIIESACKDQFQSERRIPLEDKRCAGEKALLQDHDTYVAQNFNEKVLAAKRRKASMEGLMVGGTSSAAARARANFDRRVQRQINQNREQRIEIVALVTQCSAR
mgnify:FL=1